MSLAPCTWKVYDDFSNGILMYCDMFLEALLANNFEPARPPKPRSIKRTFDDRILSWEELTSCQGGIFMCFKFRDPVDSPTMSGMFNEVKTGKTIPL
jgi:hypothetical protein